MPFATEADIIVWNQHFRKMAIYVPLIGILLTKKLGFSFIRWNRFKGLKDRVLLCPVVNITI